MPRVQGDLPTYREKHLFIKEGPKEEKSEHRTKYKFYSIHIYICSYTYIYLYLSLKG